MHPHFSLAGLFGRPPLVPALLDAHGPSQSQIDAALLDLRQAGRRSVRMLDLCCGDGERLLRAAGSARSLGFVAIEGLGVDMAPAHIRRARAHAEERADASMTLRFLAMDAIEALAAEHDEAVDLVFLPEAAPYPCSPLGMALARICSGTVLARD